MAKKTIAQIYNDAHHALGLKQNRKYGNPVTVAPAHVPEVLERAVRNRQITEEQARKLALKLGKKSYGEWGLTIGVVGQCLSEICGRFGGSMYLEAELARF